jgi:hypothetical protein
LIDRVEIGMPHPGTKERTRSDPLRIIFGFLNTPGRENVIILRLWLIRPDFIAKPKEQRLYRRLERQHHLYRRGNLDANSRTCLEKQLLTKWICSCVLKQIHITASLSEDRMSNRTRCIRADTWPSINRQLSDKEYRRQYPVFRTNRNQRRAERNQLVP